MTKSTRFAPRALPTHAHVAAFWEALGRAVATFGFLEDTLGKAIFALSGTREYPPDEIEQAAEDWLPKLQRALSDPLGRLIDSYGAELRQHPLATITNRDELLADLKKASEIRNVLCHGSWRMPDSAGQSMPHFVTKKMMAFQTPIDVAYLKQVQAHTADLISSVIDTVTHMGFQFPGSSGPGRRIYP